VVHLGSVSPEILPNEVLALKKRNAWEEIAARAAHVPEGFDAGWAPVADEIAFAFGQLHRTDEGVRLLERAFSLEPTHRRASGLAYLYYDALLGARRPKKGTPQRDREADRKAFERWVAEALKMRPGSVKDLYRLGEYEAQIQSRRDAAALRAFQAAVRAFQELPPEQRSARHHWFKPYVRSLYCGARSAFRLGRFREAQRLVFACIREDKETDHLEPVHKLYLAARTCMELGQHDHAERGFRLALDAPGMPRRDWLYSALAELCRRTGRLDEAAGWIERHVPVQRRDASQWRLLGDIRRAAQNAEGALAAYKSALGRDRGGRHLTLVRIGEIHREAGRLREARRAFEEAAEFRRRRYLTEDHAALQGLAAVLEAEKDEKALASVQEKLAKVALERRGGAA
jgi:tetratricopeptide (TPR) repeat protein